MNVFFRCLTLPLCAVSAALIQLKRKVVCNFFLLKFLTVILLVHTILYQMIKSFKVTIGVLGVVFKLWRFFCLNMNPMQGGLLLFAHVGERADKGEKFWPDPIFLSISKDINTLLSNQHYPMKKHNSLEDFGFTAWPAIVRIK